ncbi:hypothetical protein R6Q59_017663 [Mikania micrantha]
MGPVKAFRSRCRLSRLGSVASSGGMEPLKVLYDRSSVVKLLSWLRKEGMGPERLVQLMDQGIEVREIANGVGDGGGDVAREDGEGFDTVVIEVTFYVAPVTAVGVAGPRGQNGWVS